MARAPKNGKSGETEVQATTLLLPTEKKIQDLAKEKRNAKKRMQSISGEIGQSIAKAVEEKHVDRKALSMACALDAMDDERLHVTYVHLMEYIKFLGVDKRALAQAELFEDRPKEGEEPKGDGNVTHIGAAARKVAERAGAAVDA